MKRTLQFLIAAVLLTGTAFCQGVPYSGTVVNGQGQAIAGAIITVCTSAGTGAPCSPTVSIFSDAAMTHPISTLATDGFGYFQFYVTPGIYCYTATSPQIVTTTCYPFALPVMAGSAASFASLVVSGASTLANVTIGNANTLTVNNIKQGSGAAFALVDPNGISHLFISGSAPYTNTFVNGNGSGNVFLGSGAKASVSDTTGAIVTAGGVTIQNTSQLLPATVANDASGGVTTTTNGGKTLQFTNGGVLVVNPSALGRGAALTVGGTSTTTGGISVFVGASGAQTETMAIDPNDGASASLRVQSLQIRQTSSGFLNGTQVFAIANTGAIGGASFSNGIGQGSGLKHQRFGPTCTTSAVAGTSCSSTFTWTSAFADANYTVVCQGESNQGNTAALNVSSHSASQVTVSVITFVASAVSFSAANCIAIHD